MALFRVITTPFTKLKSYVHQCIVSSLVQVIPAACTTPSHYPNKRCPIVHQEQNLVRLNSKYETNAIKNVIRKLSTVSFRTQCMKCMTVWVFITGVAAFLMYFGVFLRQLGLSPSESSIIIGALPFFFGFIRPLAGSLADKLRRHKLILAIFSQLSGVIITFMLLVPAQEISSNPALDIQLKCHHQTPHISMCPRDQCAADFNATFPDRHSCVLCCSVVQSYDTPSASRMNSELLNFSVPLHFANNSSTCITTHVYESSYSEEMICNTTGIPLCKPYCSGNVTEVISCAGQPLPKFGRIFWTIWALYFVGGMFYHCSFGLLDACTYQLLEDHITDWGIQRSYGTLGSAALGFGTGYLMDALAKGDGQDNFTISFMCFFVCQLLLTVVTMMFETSRDVRCDNIFLNALHLLKDIKVFSLVVILFIFGAFFGIKEVILFWHLKNLGAPQILLGLSIAVQSLLEFIMMFASGPIIARIGDVNCIYIASIAYIIRFVALGLIRNPWLVLLPDLLHGFTFGLFFASSTVYMASVTPRGMKATVQNLLRSIHYSFGE